MGTGWSAVAPKMVVQTLTWPVGPEESDVTYDAACLVSFIV